MQGSQHTSTDAEHVPTRKEHVRLLWSLFATFMKMGVTTFSGYAMLPIAQRELVDTRGWVSDEDLADYYAIANATPGIVAVNTATFCGHKVAGNLGGILATLGFCLPGVVLVCIAALILGNFMDVPVVRSAFAGIRVAVCVLIVNTIIKLWRVSITDALGAIVFAVALVVSLFANASPVIIVLVAGIVGIMAQLVKDRRKRDGGDET